MLHSRNAPSPARTPDALSGTKTFGFIHFDLTILYLGRLFSFGAM